MILDMLSYVVHQHGGTRSAIGMFHLLDILLHFILYHSILLYFFACVINRLKTHIHLNVFKDPSYLNIQTYRAVNTLHFGYKS
jgi:hypothetical protein